MIGELIKAAFQFLAQLFSRPPANPEGFGPVVDSYAKLHEILQSHIKTSTERLEKCEQQHDMERRANADLLLKLEDASSREWLLLREVRDLKGEVEDLTSEVRDLKTEGERLKSRISELERNADPLSSAGS